jgi:hypothetical protein
MDLTVEPQMTGASLRLRLLVSGDDRLISGTMIGSAVSEEGTSIEVYGATTREPALISGRADPTSIRGMIMGQLSVAGASCSPAGHNWALTPRAAGRGA